MGFSYLSSVPTSILSVNRGKCRIYSVNSVPKNPEPNKNRIFGFGSFRFGSRYFSVRFRFSVILCPALAARAWVAAVGWGGEPDSVIREILKFDTQFDGLATFAPNSRPLQNLTPRPRIPSRKGTHPILYHFPSIWHYSLTLGDQNTLPISTPLPHVL
jgi:hypothetical protein